VNKKLAIAISLCAFCVLAFVVSCGPRLKITTRPDRQQQGNLGIGLDLRGFDSPLDSHGNPLMAHVKIKKPSGEVVLQATEDLSRFTFG
jgi:hypothetical protein